MATKAWQAHVYALGSTNTSSGNIDFTLGSSQLAGPITVRYPTVLALSGRTEGQPWEIPVLDRASSFTAQLADSSGRVDLLGRIVAVDRNLDGAGFVRHGAGRITDVVLGDDVASYRLVVQDERVAERNATIFSTNTTRIYPASPDRQYGPFRPPVRDQDVRVMARPSTTHAVIQLGGGHPRLTAEAVAAIKADLKPDASYRGVKSTVGNFTYLRFKQFLPGTDHEIYRFIGAETTPGDFGRGTLVDSLDDHVQTGSNIRVEIIATSSQMPVGTPPGLLPVIGGGFLHAMGSPPTEEWPLHVGTSGIQPVDLLEDIWQGNYSSAGTLVPRYSTAALDTLRQRSMPYVRFRVTSPANMAQWVEDHLLGPFGMAAFVDSSGSLAPKSVFLPETTAGISAFTFQSSNLRNHPTWHHASRELVTKLQFRYTHEAERQTVTRFDGPPIDTAGPFGGDGIAAEERTLDRTHDRIGNLGVFTHVVPLDGLHTVSLDVGRFPPFTEQPPQTELVDQVEFLKQEFFNRFGDGPVIGSFDALSTAESVNPGDFVAITLETFPNPQTGARTGTRYVQLLDRIDTPVGPTFSYLDAGPNSAPLSAPTLSLAKSTVEPKHQLIATVGSVPAGGSFQIQVAPSSTLPASTSTLWQSAYTVSQTSSAAYDLPLRASGLTYFGRVRARKVGRIPSTWTASTAVVLDTISAVTAIGVANISAYKADLSWTVGDSDYPVHVSVDDDHTATLGSSNRVAVLPNGSNRYTLVGLTSATTHGVGVRHGDEYGGFSAFDSTTFDSGSTAVTAPAMLGLSVLFGGST